MKKLITIFLILMSFIGTSQVVNPINYIPNFMYGIQMTRFAGNDTLMLVLRPDGVVDTMAISASSGSSSGIYVGASPATQNIGGYTAGDAITGTYDAIIEKLLTPYQLPAFVTFTMTGQATPVEVGTTISGSKNFAWTYTNSSNIAINTLDIFDVTNATFQATDISIVSPSSVSIGSIQKNTATSHSWNVQATNTNADIFKSANYTVNWRWRRNWGFDTDGTITSAEMVAGSGELSTSRAKTYTTVTPTGSQYMYYSYPSSFGDLTEIFINGFPSISAFTKLVVSHTNSKGVVVNYNVYKSNNLFTSSVNVITQ